MPTNTLEINLVAGCAVKCSYCPWENLIKSYKRDDPTLKFNLKKNEVPLMEFSTFKTILSKLPTDTWIDFSGWTECFLHPAAEDFIIYAHEQNFPIRLFSTLANSSIPRLEKLKNVPFIVVTLHVADNCGMLNVRVDNQYVENIKYVAAHFQNVHAHTFGYMHDKLRQDLGITIDEKINNRDIISRASNKEFKNEVIQLTLPGHKTGPIICKAMKDKGSQKYSHNVVDIYGSVFLCCCDFSRSVKLGNLLEQSYDSLFLSDEYNKIIEGSKAQDSDIICRGCELSVSHNWA